MIVFTKAGVALGSNLGDRRANLRAACVAIGRLAGVTQPIVTSSIYETEPVDCEPDAPSFLNALMEFGYSGSPLNLWLELQKIEVELGRPPDHERNVSRLIDVDLLYFGDVRLVTNELILPHPRIHERRFVLAPLEEINPDLILPLQNKTIRELLASLGESAKVTRLEKDWCS
jgi:2-amino-4-hydroxy-6-hydroxymethyldihydropteridine diphosphokinase